MKVYVLGTRGFPNIQGGVEKHCEYLYPCLADKFAITVFRRKAYLDPDKDNNMPGIRFIDLPSTRIKGFEAVFHSFLCTLYCIAQQPDIVHVHNIGPGMFIPILKLFGRKVILTYHSPNYEHKKWGFLSRKLLKLSERIATNAANRIIFVNKSLRETFPEKMQQKSTFIPNGVDIKKRSNDTDYISSIGLTKEKYILAVGRITQEKGFDYMIDAFLEANLPDYKLVIAGGIDHKSKYADEFLKKTREETNILMPGYVDGENLRQLYSHAALFILPSYNEGFPLVLLEAMSYSLPILASDIPGNKQLELPDDHYFKPGDSTTLSSMISKQLAEDRIVHYDLSAYTWENVASQTEKVFLSIK